ncbi:MAG: WD40 repeat domain-containing protein [Cyclobacteriaceae bacterium]|nr:WD40 repeat domain-containing protein [Cyclobacteriaceae bacterium]MCH8515155.1 WD40 repeat domain-containing protein [Cyclobacteriaceae bacterium]
MRKKLDIEKTFSLLGHKDCIYTLEKGKDEKEFFSAGGDGLVVKWHIDKPESGQLVAKVDGSVYALHYDAERDLLAVGQNFEGVHLIRPSSKEIVASRKLGKVAIFDIFIVQDYLFASDGAGRVHIMTLNGLNMVKILNDSEESARCMAYHQERAELAVGYSDKRIRVYDLRNLSLKYDFAAHDNSVFTLQYSHDGKFLLSGSRDAHLKAWDIQNEYQEKGQIVAHMYAINHIAFSDDGKYFLTCSMDKSVKVWDGKSYGLLKVLDKARHAGHGTSVNKVLWRKPKGDDYHIISASDDRSISMWRLKNETVDQS